MLWWWNGGGTWWFGLINAAVLVAVVVGAVYLLRKELPQLQRHFGEPPALRMLEERYARGEVSREEFLERRRVLLESPPATAPVPPSAPAPSAPSPPPPPPGSLPGDATGRGPEPSNPPSPFPPGS